MATTEMILAVVNECTWDYAGLTHAAHLAGGPGEFIKAVSDSAEAAGRAAGHAAGLVEGATKAGPIGFALGAAFVLGAGYVYLRRKDDMSVYKAEKARSVAAANAYVDASETSFHDAGPARRSR